jgi:hypothetical protein
LINIKAPRRLTPEHSFGPGAVAGGESRDSRLARRNWRMVNCDGNNKKGVHKAKLLEAE